MWARRRGRDKRGRLAEGGTKNSQPRRRGAADKWNNLRRLAVAPAVGTAATVASRILMTSFRRHLLPTATSRYDEATTRWVVRPSRHPLRLITSGGDRTDGRSTNAFWWRRQRHLVIVIRTSLINTAGVNPVNWWRFPGISAVRPNSARNRNFSLQSHLNYLERSGRGVLG